MRFVAFAILCYLTLGVQLGASPFVRVGGAAPNLVMLSAVFVALNAPRQPALLGCFAIGLLQDLLTADTLGVHALAYGCIGWVIASSQTLMFRDHPITHMSMAFFGCVFLSVLLLVQQSVQGWLYPPAKVLEGAAPQRVSALTVLWMTLLTTAISPVVLGLLQRVRWLFGFRPAARQRL